MYVVSQIWGAHRTWSFQIIVSFQSEFLIKIDNFCKRDKNYARTRTNFFMLLFCIEYHKYDSILFCEILFDPIQ